MEIGENDLPVMPVPCFCRCGLKFLANPGFFHANYASFYPISRSGIAFRVKTHLLADEGPRKNMDLALIRGYF